MDVKDYYQTLEVSSNASQAEIKKSYRRLAIKFHPDKNFGNAISEAKFKELQEAYRVLSNVQKREDYNYERNKRSTFATKEKPQPTITPQTILKQITDFRRKVAVLDPDRMNKLALYQQIQTLLSNKNIVLLKSNNDSKLNRRIIEELMFCSRHLPFVHVEKICFQLTALAGTDNTIYRKIYAFSRHIKRQEYWNKYKILAAIVISIIICIAIFELGVNL